MTVLARFSHSNNPIPSASYFEMSAEVPGAPIWPEIENSELFLWSDGYESELLYA
jgi:hypothetical protein